jgi:glutamyl-tRNA synthetase
MIRTRFAPSPTGFVHIGSLRTALFAFLFARHNQGVNVLRIEDTDQNRKVEGAVENLVKIMKEVGIEFDEGFYTKEDGNIEERGEFGPYLQSRRLEKYKVAADQLLENGNAYFCFCDEERLAEVRKEQMALKKPAMYDRKCKKLSKEEIIAKQEEFKKAGKNPVIRFAIPEEGTTTINDLIYGEITYDHKVLDDQVIIKSDGFPTYHLAVVVDDHFMEITHVIRGDEWIPSTPKHLLLYKALGWQPTQFAHLPLILNPDKTKLSKRQGDVAVEDFLKHGYLKEALINFVAFLGWNPKTEKEIFSLEELISQFDLKNVNKSGAVFDDNKLDWFNSQYIKQLNNEALVEKLKPFWKESGIKIEKFDNNYLSAVAGLEKERLKKLSEIGDRTKYFFTQPEYESTLLVWKKSTAKETKEKLSALLITFGNFNESDFSKETLETKTKQFIEQKNFDNGSVLWPLRTALTGLEKSPGPFEVASTLALGLGKNEIIKRIEKAINKLEP